MTYTIIFLLVLAVVIYFVWNKKPKEIGSSRAKKEDYNPEFATKPEEEEERSTEKKADQTRDASQPKRGS